MKYAAKKRTAPSSETKSGPSDSAKSWREAIESIVIAIVLAFLFRAFEAEAFVIPTGSMAPTLQGRHMEITCPECGHSYRVGASADAEMQQGQVIATTCPMCFFTVQLHGSGFDPDHVAHTGDRILVNKFAYQAPFGQPERWDVIVFKYPGNAKQNYIKRLVGLPGETLKIQHGDIYARQSDEEPFQIVRKPSDKLKHMLQLVHDSQFVSPRLVEAGWPVNWQIRQPAATAGWTTEDHGRTFYCQPTSEEAWLYYSQYSPNFWQWELIWNDRPFDQREPARPILITDFYAYNAQTREGGHHPFPDGMHWVGDLALEAELQVLSDQGEIVLELIEAGRHHRCRLDVATGQATLSLSGQARFDSQDDQPGKQELSTQTSLRGKGNYSVRFANVDDQLVLWIDGDVCTFDQPTTFQTPEEERPVATAEDPGDLAPVRIGATGVELGVENLRVLRDVYYIATRSETLDYRTFRHMERIREQLMNPRLWNMPGNLFDDRRTNVTFELDADQFFPLGDNSPFSKDGRLWGNEHYVEREMLIGKAVLIYWPHPYRVHIPFTHRTIPIFPNFRRMGFIH